MSPSSMSPSSMSLMATACLIAAGCAASSPSVPTTDGIVVVVDAAVYTVNPIQPVASSFAYDARGVIIAVGTEAEVMAAAGDDPTVIDAAGNMVLPGFQDVHVHVPEAGINNGLCLLDPGLSLAEYETVARRLRRRATRLRLGARRRRIAVRPP